MFFSTPDGSDVATSGARTTSVFGTAAQTKLFQQKLVSIVTRQNPILIVELVVSAAILSFNLVGDAPKKQNHSL